MAEIIAIIRGFGITEIRLFDASKKRKIKKQKKHHGQMDLFLGPLRENGEKRNYLIKIKAKHHMLMDSSVSLSSTKCPKTKFRPKYFQRAYM